MNSIGFTNFRKFINFPEKPFGDITIMVGGNNAGKSTIVKAMLLMRDFLKSRIESVSNTSIFKSFSPQFSFDAEHVNVGDFYRAFCRQSPDTEDTISFAMQVDKFHFIVNLRGERKPGIIPQVSTIAVKDETRGALFTFDFVKNQMSVSFDNKDGIFDDNTITGKIVDRRQHLKELKERLAKSQDLAEITELKFEIEEIEKYLNTFSHLLSLDQSVSINKVGEEGVTIDMSFFMGDNTGKLVIPELIKGFVQYAWTGTLGDKRSIKYKEQEANKSFLQGKAEVINKIVTELESVLNSQVLEYVYSHSAAQTPCYSNATSSNDYATRTIHDFYRARISSGDEEFNVIETGMKLFNIGSSLKVISFLGDSYRVVIFDEENPENADSQQEGYPGGMDLADKGMGSIQITLLLLRLATLARKYKGLNLTVLLEEPEQNLHPAMQSKLADLLRYVNKNFDIRFIVETHSEYLVRKSQVIVAEENFGDDKELKEKNCFKVYYLPSDGEEPYEMLFTKSGRFTNKFGEGFYDEAGKSNLITLRKEKGLK